MVKMQLLMSLHWLALCSTFQGALGVYHNWTTANAGADGLLANLTLAQLTNITAGSNVQGVFTQTSSLDGWFLRVLAIVHVRLISCFIRSEWRQYRDRSVRIRHCADFRDVVR
jgi:hypothetical protein